MLTKKSCTVINLDNFWFAWVSWQLSWYEHGFTLIIEKKNTEIIAQSCSSIRYWQQIFHSLPVLLLFRETTLIWWIYFLLFSVTCSSAWCMPPVFSGSVFHYTFCYKVSLLFSTGTNNVEQLQIYLTIWIYDLWFPLYSEQYMGIIQVWNNIRQ